MTKGIDNAGRCFQDGTTKLIIRLTQELIEIMVKSSAGKLVGGNRKQKLARIVQGLKPSRSVSWHSSPCCCEEKEKSPRCRVTTDR